MGDIVYIQESGKFITIPDGDIATHEQIRDFFMQREMEMQMRPVKPSAYNDVCKYFRID